MDIDDEWEIDEFLDDEEEVGGKFVKIKEEVLLELEIEVY